ncbi:MAG: DUF255 domain-containing protein, partial [Campylobacterota bacterium]|nr:DUF255 domain-containing protein [Campylobacterota bacterium]
SKAVQENKILYVMIVSESCRWCRKMEKTTLLDNMIIKRLEDNFIAVELLRGIDTYPDSFQAKMVPKHYFLTPKEKKIYALPGYWSVEDFSSILDDVVRKYQKLR